MKKKIILILILLSFIPLYFVFNQPLALAIEKTYTPNDVGVLMEEEFITSTRNVLNYQLVAENNFLKLFLNQNTTQFAVVDKRNDYIWYSSVFTSDNSATNTVRNLQKSTFAVRYLETDNTTKYITNYEYSILSKTFEIDLDSIENGFRINYTLKDSVPKGYWLPTKISKERFLEKVRTPFENYDFTPDDDFTYADMIRVLNNYYRPLEEDPDTYQITVIQQGLDTTSLGRIETQELFYLFYVIGTYGNEIDEEGNFVESYTLDDVGLDNFAYEINIELSDPEFYVPLEVRLEADHIDTRIRFDEIEQKSPYQITSIQMLPYLGAGNENRSGYLVIPEGSGGIIHFNNGKTRQRSYSSYLYDRDTTVIPTMLTLSDTGARIPIYGLKHENNAVLAIIEEGQSHAMITAEVSGKTDRFNKAYSEFTFKESGLYYLTQQGVSIWNPDQYDYSPNIRYYFFSEDQANYTSMATLYGGYLESKYNLLKQAALSPEVYLDIIGSFDALEYFLFFPYKDVQSLTTYEQATQIIQSLETAGLDHLVVNYKGWFNNGLNHELPNHIQLDRSVGTVRQMNTFVGQHPSHALYFDVDFMKLYDRPLFYSNRHISRIVGGTVSEFYPYDIATRLPDKTKDPLYYLKLQSSYQNMQGFLSDFDRLDATGLSLRNMGQMLNSDFHRNNGLYRYQMIPYIQAMLQGISQNQTLLLDFANDYALPFVSHLANVPTITSNYLMVDQAIPFYQLAIAGRISYSMPSININQVYSNDYYLLKALETGSNLKFTVTYQDTSLLMKTEYNQFFATEFEGLKNQMIHLSNTFQTLIGANNYLVSHEIVSPTLIVVEYASGLRLELDYSTLTFRIL